MERNILIFSLMLLPIFIWLVWRSAVALAHAVRNFLDASTSKRWPMTQGTVKTSLSEDKDENDQTYYYADVVYTYAVDGIDYQSYWVGFKVLSAMWDYSRDKVDRWVANSKYPFMSQVTVYYDSRNPQRAVLEPGMQKGITVALIRQIVCLLLALSYGTLPAAASLLSKTSDRVPEGTLGVLFWSVVGLITVVMLGGVPLGVLLLSGRD